MPRRRSCESKQEQLLPKFEDSRRPPALVQWVKGSGFLGAWWAGRRGSGGFNGVVNGGLVGGGGGGPGGLVGVWWWGGVGVGVGALFGGQRYYTSTASYR